MSHIEAEAEEEKREEKGIDEYSDMIDPGSKLIKRDGLIYTASYCEENIYCLLRDHVPAGERGQYTVVFISNEEKCVPLFFQKDYHVLLLHSAPHSHSHVYDFDTRLPFRTSFASYFTQTLYGLLTTPAEISSKIQEYLEFHPRCFKLVAAEEYLRCFASDRRHMKRLVEVEDEGAEEEGGVERKIVREEWIAAPPLYGPIVAANGAENTLPIFLDFTPEFQASQFGRIVDEATFLELFGGVES
ncbi:hypothetical protein RUND412_001943 [Rhizina undulata]